MLVAIAPGRLDVMGGIADYSGALVLQLPLDRTTRVTLEQQEAPRLDVVSRRDGRLESFGMDLDAAVPRQPSWAPYVAGVMQFCRERAGKHAPGMRLRIESTVPEGKGVASSAALEVACMMVVAAHWDVSMTPEELATACQWVENHVVGAPCGIMDQMTSACGQRDRLLRLRCQPGTIEGQLEIPAGYRFYAIDSGIRHAVTGADYETVRTAAFMGLRIIAEAAEPVAVPYLADLTTATYTARYERLLPERISGAEFLARYGGITDPATKVRPERSYPVRQATAHPVYEQERVERFARLLEVLSREKQAASALGRLMLDSHASYGACGLGSDGTDRLVELVMAAGPERGLFGAKITGAGSGGTVSILGTDRAEPVVREIAARYGADTGRQVEVFTGSGPGAAQIGIGRIV